MPSQRTTRQRRFSRRISRPSFQQIIALALVAALLAPISALARPLANGWQSPPAGLLTGTVSGGWGKLATFIGLAQDERPAQRLAPERPRPEPRPANLPLGKVEREARAVRLEINGRKSLQLEPKQREVLTAVPVDAHGDAVHGLAVDWQSSDPRVVEIGRDAVAIAIQPGTAHLTASLGSHKATVPVQVAASASRSVAAGRESSGRAGSRLGSAGATRPVRFTNARWSSATGSSPERAARATRQAKFITTALLQEPLDEGRLPNAETASLYSSENNVGRPRGRTEPGATIPPAAVAGTETPVSANFTFNVPLLDLPGRGLGLSLGLTYNSRVWHKSTTVTGHTALTFDVDSGSPAPGFRLGYGYLESHGEAGWTLVDAAGTRRQMINLNPAVPHVVETTDGSFIKYDTINRFMTTADGATIYYWSSDGPRLFPSRIRDRNGNYMNLGDVYTDALRRYVIFRRDADNNLVTITAPGYGYGADRQVARFYYRELPIGASFQPNITTRNVPQTARVLEYVYFNTDGVGTGYRFDYSSYGMIYRIVQLRGMTVSTTALEDTGTVTGEGQVAATTEYNYPTGPSNLADVPQFTRRTDEWAGRTAGMSGTGAAPYHTFAVVPGAGTLLSRITAPDGTLTEALTDVAAGGWNDGLVKDVAVKQGATVMARSVTVWEHDGSSRNQRPRETRVTNEANETRTARYSYTGYNNPSAVREFDFNGTTELRRTEMLYETRTQYRDRGLVHLPTEVKIFANGSTVPAARAVYGYDTAGENLTAYPEDEMGHHYSDWNPLSIYYDPATDNRGNLTSVTRYANAAAGTGAETDTLAYDIAGNLVRQTSACCQQKSYTYHWDFMHAYPTEAARGSAGQLRTSTYYDFHTGLLRTATDVNNNQTSTFDYYADSLRLYRTDQPNGGYTYHEYGDRLYQNGAPNRMHSFHYTTTKLDAAGREVLNDRYVDGRGAPARSFANYATSGANPTTTDLNYDGMGRPINFSNPYTSTGVGSPINPADLWSKESYDALGRTSSVTMPDNTVTSISYAGKFTTVTDAAGKSRRQVHDALGRVVRVDEPNAAGSLGTTGAPVQPTAYTYNVVGGLVRVQQGAQNRYFRYDSLGRLTHERQVEQGAPHSFTDPLTGNNAWSQRMVYDAEGRLGEVFDARNIRTQYSYDSLNRMTQAVYSDGTPSVSYTYDQARAGYHNHGRLTEVATAATSAAPLTRLVYDYTEMGQVARQQQTIASSTYTLTYGYNQAGQLESETYPSGRVVKYDYDNAARLSSVVDATNAAAPRTYANNFAYSEHNALTSESWGNGAVHTISYNTRLQPTQIKLLVGGAERQRFAYRYGQVNLSTGAVDAAKNTGHVGRTDGFINGVKQWEQRYGYDSLDRLDIAAEHRGDNAALVYRADYDYDRYSNRLQTGGQNFNLAYTPVAAADITAGTNRFASGVTYDAAGNTTVDNKFRVMQYQYDANSRMKWAARTDGTGVSTSVYDGAGQRVQTVVGGVTRHLIYGLRGKLVAEYEPASGGWKRDHIYRGGELLVTEEAGGAKRYVLADRQSSTRAVLDGSATVVARHDYLPFGEEISAGTGMRTTAQGFGATHAIRQRYAGTERDDGTGLEHTQWRKLESRAGRWTSPDPYKGSMSVGDPQSMNRYAYVGNDPANRTDPSGLFSAFEASYNPFYHFYSGGGGGGVGYTATVYSGPTSSFVSSYNYAGSGIIYSGGAGSLPSSGGSGYPGGSGTGTTTPTPTPGDGQIGQNPENNGCGPANNPALASLVPELFPNACAKHDACYGTLGANKEQCDAQLLQGAFVECINAGNPLQFCSDAANVYFRGVQLFGVSAFNDAQVEAYAQDGRAGQFQPLSLDPTGTTPAIVESWNRLANEVRRLYGYPY